MTSFRPWWEVYPEVLQAEEQGLEHLGGRAPVLNEQLLADTGIREYDTRYCDGEGNDFDLTVTYSDFHPFFGPTVATSHLFGNHQEPFGGRLCLLRGGTAEWDVGETAAEMIAEQMPKLLRDRRDLTGGEQHAAEEAPGSVPPPNVPHVEPYVGYYSYTEATVVRVDGSWAAVVEADHGTLTIGVEPNAPIHQLRGAVREVRGSDAIVLRECDPVVKDMFSTTINARWCRLRKRPSADGGPAALEAAINEQPTFARPEFQPIPGGQLDVLGVVFTDDIDADIITGAVRRGDAWMFIVRARGPATQPGKRGRSVSRGRTTAPADRAEPYLARAMRAGRADVAARIPTLEALSAKTIALFGTGAIGAPSAIEFAKAGLGRLYGVEHDDLEAGNAVRWPLGHLVAGHHKLMALQHHLALHWPFTTFVGLGMGLGIPRDGRSPERQWELLEKVIEGADLVFDSTAEPGVNYFLSELAKERGVPYVVVSATEGGWGGYVARVQPGADEPCWRCLMHHFEDDPSLLPPSDPDPATRSVWPAGCTDPTFTGAGFDVSTMAYAAVRLSVATLTAGLEGAYPPANWNYGRYSFRNGDWALPGTGEAMTLHRHPRCRRCQA